MITTRAIWHLLCQTPHTMMEAMQRFCRISFHSRVNVPNECKDNTHRPKGAMQGFTEDIQ